MPAVTAQRDTEAAAGDGRQTWQQGEQEGQVDCHERIVHLVRHSVTLAVVETVRPVGRIFASVAVTPATASAGVADGCCRGEQLYDVPSAGDCRVAGAPSRGPAALLERRAARFNLDGGGLENHLAECGGCEPKRHQYHAEAVQAHESPHQCGVARLGTNVAAPDDQHTERDRYQRHVRPGLIEIASSHGKLDHAEDVGGYEHPPDSL